MILFEIFGRSGPFGVTALNPREIWAELRVDVAPDQEPFRPPVDTLGANVPEFVVSLMTDCWREEPLLRPDFKTIRNRLTPMQGGL